MGYTADPSGFHPIIRYVKDSVCSNGKPAPIPTTTKSPIILDEDPGPNKNDPKRSPCETRTVAQPISDDCQKDQKCEITYAEKCLTKYEQECQTKYVPKCEVTYTDVCDTEYEDECVDE